MKNTLIILFLFVLQGCWICPDPIFIEFNYPKQTVEVLSDDYFIKSVTITEYLSKEGAIEMIDSNKVMVEQFGARGANILSLLDFGEHYKSNSSNLKEILEKNNLQLEIRLEKYLIKKKGNEFDVEIIEFVKEDGKDKVKYNSKHPCP